MNPEEELNPYDPVVAERFELMAQATPPTLDSVLDRGEHAVALTATPHERPDRVPFYLLAAAACIALIAGAVVIATSDGDPEADVAATDRTGSRIQADADDLESDRRASGETETERRTDTNPVLDVPAADDEDDGDTSTSSSTTTTTDAPRVTKPFETVPQETKPPETAPTETGPADTGPTETKPAETLPPVTKPKPIEPDPKPLPLPLPTIRPPPTVDEEALVVVRGVMTELFTDCQSKLIFEESTREVVRGQGISCDGGSYVVVDGRRIQTTSGFGPAEWFFDRHPPQSMLGQKVEVVAARAPFGGDNLWLNCAQCGVRLDK